MNAQYMNMNNCGMFNVSLWKWNGDNFIHFAPCCSLFQQKFIANISQSNSVISYSYFSQSVPRKGCPIRNPSFYIHAIISFVIFYETSWNFVIMFGYENYSSDKNMESR